MKYAYASSRSGKVVHRTEGALAYDHGRAGKHYRWLCGGGAWNPTFVDELPFGRRQCAACFTDEPLTAGVYFAARDGLVKIGCSTRVGLRVREQGASLLAVQAGDYEVERTLHRVFADDCVVGEWFTPSPALLAYIDRLNAEQSPASERAA